MKKNILKGLAMLCLAAMAGKATAQDIHFSQYNAAPMQLNPALAGMNECDYRVHANFRMQWPTVSAGNTYRTFAGGADMGIGKVTKYNSFAGLGLSFFSDQAGDLNLSTNRVDLTFAYHFMLDKKGEHQISVGLQGGFNMRNINPANATYDSQYDPATGQLLSGNQESFGRTRVMFGDAGFGLLYSTMVKRKNNIFLGFALNHVNQPKVSFRPNGQDASTAGNERLAMKATIHGGAAVPVGKRLVVMPNFLVLLQATAYEFNVGCNFKTILGNNPASSKTALHLGLQYRGLVDAMIVNARIDVQGFTCGLSYDINLSKLTPASSSVGAPEISLMYQGCYRKKPRPGHCPVLF